MSLPKSEALKQSDGSFIVRVFHAFDRSTDVVFPHTPEAPLLALEYANFKTAQRESGPESPATVAVVSELKKMSSNDKHEQLMAAAQTEQVPENALTPEEQEINAISPNTITMGVPLAVREATEKGTEQLKAGQGQPIEVLDGPAQTSTDETEAPAPVAEE